MAYAIEVNHLNKSFEVGFLQKPKQVLFDVQFKVREGKTTGFVGNNGSGKTTSIKCIFDFIKPSQGEILFWGKPISSAIKARIGYLPERPYLYEFMTSLEFLRFHWDLAGLPENGFMTKAEEVLEKVGLSHAKNKTLREFSKGMLQREGIAQALLTNPDLLIFDEPMSGLDPDGRGMVKDIIRNEQKKGVTLFFSSHLLQDMDELCDDLVVINKGKIIYCGDLPTFKAQFKTLEEAFLYSKQQIQV